MRPVRRTRRLGVVLVMSALIVALLAVVATWAVLGSNGTGTISAPGGADPGGGDDELAPPTGAIELWVVESYFSSWQELHDQIVSQTEVDLRITEVSFEEFDAKVDEALTDGAPPDLLMGPDFLINKYAGQDALQPIQLDAEQQARFTEDTLRSVTDNGQLYALPYCSHTVGLYRNTTMVPEAPETFDELISTSQSMVDTGVAEPGLAVPFSDTLGHLFMYPLFTGAGGYVLGTEDDGDYDPTDVGLDSPASIAAIEQLAQWDDGRALSTELDIVASRSLFAAGRMPFFIDTAAGVEFMPDVEFEVTAFPSSTPGTPASPILDSTVLVAPSGGPNAEAAHAFLTQVMLDGGGLAEMYGHLNFDLPCVPALAEVTEIPTIDAASMAGFRSAAATGVPRFSGATAAAWSPYTETLDSVRLDGADATSAASAAAQTIRDELNG